MSEYPKVFRNGQLVPKSEAGPKYESNSAPHVISDNMQPLKHHGNGRIIDSKRAFSKTTRELGMVELGNEQPKARKPIPLDRRQRREDIKRAVYQLKNR